MMTPFESLLANQYEDGIPRHTQWDVFGEQHNPRGSQKFILDTPDHHGGNAYTDKSPVLPFGNPINPIVYSYDGNYQGVAPLELQPLLNLPNPWE